MTLLLALLVAFDVATVKVSPPTPVGSPIPINLGAFRNGTLTLQNATLAECLQYAYNLPSEDQVDGPDWLKSRETRFDIVGKTPPDTSIDGARQMLQSLLAERLKVALRVQPRTFTFAALVPAKAGHKLVEAPLTATTANMGLPGRITGQSMPMYVLASLLSRFESQLVVDRTGLTGRYQFKLEWAVQNGPNPGREGPSLSSALEEQLGLRLETRREPLDVIVVERAEKMPSEN